MLAGELGRPLTEELFKISFGMRNAQVIPDVFGWAVPGDLELIQELGDRKEAIYRELLKADGLEPLPGVTSFLGALREAGIPVSVGSSTPRLNIEVCLAITGLDGYFGPNYTGAEDVSRGKPDPEVFIKAARRIDREPGRCFVVEDAHVGIQAGRRAGMKTIAVTTTHPEATFTGDSAPDRIVDSLAEVSIAQVRALFGA